MFVGTMLTMVLLMRALDPLSHEKETESYLEKLSQVDCYRRGYYKDLSKYHPTLQITWGTGQWLLVRLTPWLSDWLADLMIGLTYRPTDWLREQLTDWLKERLTDWLTDWLREWLTNWLKDWMTDWESDWLTDWLIDWPTWLTNWESYWLTDRPTNQPTKLWID